MVEVSDFPSATRSLELALKPVQLLLVHVVAVEREKPYIFLRLKRVVVLAAHVEFLIGNLAGGIVMISERGIKLHAGVEQRLIRLLELLVEILRSFAAIEVVPHHHDEREWVF